MSLIQRIIDQQIQLKNTWDLHRADLSELNTICMQNFREISQTERTICELHEELQKLLSDTKDTNDAEFETKWRNILEQANVLAGSLEVRKQIFINSADKFDLEHKAIKEKPRYFNRVAVIFVGHYRTFKLCQPQHLNFFNKFSKNVDYYFVTWDSANDAGQQKIIPKIDIEVYFGNMLKGMAVVKNEEIKNNTNMAAGRFKALRLSYLAKIAQQLKQDYESKNNFVYDQVIETRPDLWFKEDADGNFRNHYICENREVVSDKLSGDQSNLISNWYWRTNSETNNLLASRFEFLLNKNASDLDNSFHTAMTEYINHNNFKIVNYTDVVDSVPIFSEADINLPN